MEAVERVYRRLVGIIGASPRDYAERICTAFLEDQDKDKIYEHIVKLSKLQKSIYRYQNEVYALSGMGAEQLRAAEVLREVVTMVTWIEEILCYAMVDFEEVRDRYTGKQFMYQAK